MRKAIAVGILSLVLGCSQNKTPPVQYQPEINDNPSEVVEGQIVIDLKDDLTEKQIAEFASDYDLDLKPTALWASTKEEVATIDPDNEDALIERLRHDSRVEIAESVGIMHISMKPNDPEYPQQWGMQRVNAESAWQFATGRGVVVAVVDTGISYRSTPDGFFQLSDYNKAKFLDGWNFIDNNDKANDDHGHGSHCASTVAESTNNGIGATGLAFHVTLMPVKVLSKNGSGSTVGVADGIRWAADHSANVISMSLGGGAPSKLMQKSIDYAKSKAVTIVVAAGNTGGPVESPGSADGVVAVSASDEKDALAKFSSRGKQIKVAAPGTNILQQTICQGKGGKENCEAFYSWNGTSMATPHVAATAALIESLGVSNPDKVEEYITSSARKVSDSDADRNLYGSGILDAGAAVRNVTVSHAFWRILALLGLTLWVGFAVEKTKGDSPWNWKFMLGAFATGPGLFFFAPWILSRSELVVDLVSRPLADIDLMFFGYQIHKWLPFATALIPFGLTTLCYGNKVARNIVAGTSVGTAAYLLATIYQNELASPLGRAGSILWMGANIAACLWVAKTNLLVKNADQPVEPPPVD